MARAKFTPADLEAGLAKWREDGNFSYTAYTIRRMFGLTKPMLHALEADGRVTSEGRMETYEHWGFMGRGNLHRVQKFRVYYKMSSGA